jgi:hypothetical protein
LIFFEDIKDFEAELQTLISWSFYIYENKIIYIIVTKYLFSSHLQSQRIYI